MTVVSLAHRNILRAQTLVSKRNFKVSKLRKAMVILLIFAIVTSGFLYILEKNTKTAQGYKIRNLGNQLSDLKQINKNLEISISNLKSSTFLQSKIEELQMVKLNNQIEFLTFPSIGGVAAK